MANGFHTRHRRRALPDSRRCSAISRAAPGREASRFGGLCQGHSVTLRAADKVSEFVRRSQARCARIDDHSTACVIKHANRDAAKRAVDSTAERGGRCVAFVDEGTCMPAAAMLP